MVLSGIEWHTIGTKDNKQWYWLYNVYCNLQAVFAACIPFNKIVGCLLFQSETSHEQSGGPAQHRGSVRASQFSPSSPGFDSRHYQGILILFLLLPRLINGLYECGKLNEPIQYKSWVCTKKRWTIWGNWSWSGTCTAGWTCGRGSTSWSRCSGRRPCPRRSFRRSRRWTRCGGNLQKQEQAKTLKANNELS